MANLAQAIDHIRVGHVGQTAQALLQSLGETLGVSRAYVFRMHDEPVRVTQLREWVAEGIKPEIDNELLQDADLAELGFGRWMDELQSDQIICGPVDTFPESEQVLLRDQDIQSLLAVPIHHNGIWGFVGFDDCTTPRAWSREEIAAIQRAADLLGEVIAMVEKTTK